MENIPGFTRRNPEPRLGSTRSSFQPQFIQGSPGGFQPLPSLLGAVCRGVNPHVGLPAPNPGLGPSGAHGGVVIPDPPPGMIPDPPRGIPDPPRGIQVFPVPQGLPSTLRFPDPAPAALGIPPRGAAGSPGGTEVDPWDPRERGWEIRDKPAQCLLRSLGSLWYSQEEAPAAASGDPEHPKPSEEGDS